MFSFFSFYPLALWCVFRLNSVGAGHTGDPKENVLETLFDYLVMRGGVTETRSPSTKHCHHSTENKLIFVWHTEEVSCPFFFFFLQQCYEMNVSSQPFLDWGMAWQVLRWLTGPLHRLWDGLSAQSFHLGLRSNKIQCGYNKISGW